MSVIFQQGQELTEGGLKVLFKNANDIAITTMDIRYSIYLYSSGDWISLEDQYHQTPENSATEGKYWIFWEIPSGQTIGLYQIRWDFRIDVNDMWKQSRMNFQIVNYQTTSPVRTAELSDLADTPIVIVR